MTVAPHYRDDVVFFYQHPSQRYRLRLAQPAEAALYESARGPCSPNKVCCVLVYRATAATLFGCTFVATEPPAGDIANSDGRAMWEQLRTALVEAQRRVLQ